MTSRRYLRQNIPRGRIYFPCLSCGRTAVDPGIGSPAPSGPEGQKTAGPAHGNPARPAADFGTIALQRRFFPAVPHPHPGDQPALLPHAVHAPAGEPGPHGQVQKERRAQRAVEGAVQRRLLEQPSGGGIHVNHLRKAAYRAFLEAEQLARDLGNVHPVDHQHGFRHGRGERVPLPGGGHQRLRAPPGGALFELDFLPALWNYQDTLARWPEDRGKGSDSPGCRVQEDGCDRHWRRSSWITSFPPGVSLASFDRMDYRKRETSSMPILRGAEAGPRAAGARPAVPERCEIADGRSCDPAAAEAVPVPSAAGCRCQMQLTNLTPGEISFRYATEINLALASPRPLRMSGPSEGGGAAAGSSDGTAWRLADWTGWRCRTCSTASGSTCPVEPRTSTVGPARRNLSRTGPESEYQGSCFVPAGRSG
jgi:hypothetical protein